MMLIALKPRCQTGGVVLVQHLLLGHRLDKKAPSHLDADEQPTFGQEWP